MRPIPGLAGRWEVLHTEREADLGQGRHRWVVQIVEHLDDDRTEMVTMRIDTTQAGFNRFLATFG